MSLCRNELIVCLPAQYTVQSWSSSSHGVLFLSVVVSTTDRQVSRMVAFFHADERPIFSGFKYNTIQYNAIKYLYSAYSHRVSRALRRRQLISNVQKGRF